MADFLLSKVKIGTQVYDLKDAQGRLDLVQLKADLKAAAYRDVAATMSDADGKIADAATVKAYVDAQIGTIKQFDIVVADKLPEASADTMYKLYLIPKAGSEEKNVKEEYITIRNGVEGSYTYAWEKIGDTAIDLSGYVQKTQKIAGIDMQDDIAVEELEEALDMGLLSHKDAGTVTIETADAVTMDSYTPAGNVTLNDLTQTSTAATLTKADYTPAGSVTGTVVPTGTVNVTIKDAASASDITNLTYESYTPAGTIAATVAGSFSALKSATFGEDSTNGVQIEGTVTAPAITVTAGAEKTFATGLTGGSAASIDTSKFSGGSFTGASPASFTQGAKASFTQGAKASLSTSTISYVESGVEVAVDGANPEMLVFTDVTAKSAKAVDTFTANGDDSFTANGDDSFTANNVGTFTAAAISDGFFTPNTLQGVSTDKVHDTPTAALAESPAFVGKKYKVATTDDVALKEVAFTGTAADIKLSGAKYLKQEINTATFTGNASGDAINASFAGTEVKNFQVTGVNYDKATANGASFTGTAEVLTGTVNKSEKTIDVDFSKKA